ncbi:granulin a isoform X2 [Siniperca chuatsi]|uniref:granulin a isoform X2 n=1 Tax=Siniperca chuatsi TaxID=119488 RepID=UPI001CE084DE|nr:granulin a isoform X2 [Siniperca chuatsi]
MQKWIVICWALLALVGADECPDGGRCENGQSCCNNPANGYECCPFDQAECCGDHMHCCPGGTICDSATSSCVNATASFPWVKRASADQPGLSKSFRMIKTYMGEEDDNICPDQSRCPPEFSCLKALTRFGCCPLAQGVPCSDGKHCCPEGHQCSSDSRSCIRKDIVTTVLCSDGVSECPDETTCCETPEGKWGCCPMPKAVCCEDKTHCCPEGTTCDIEHNKCISSSTKKEMPMWAKLPARMRAEWENQKEAEQVSAETVNVGGSKKNPEVTPVNTVPHSEKEVSLSSVTKAAAGSDVPCDDTTACQDGTTCCKTKEGGWACCPLPEAVCCDDHEHCCPTGTTCDLATLSCQSSSGSTPMQRKMPAFATAAPTTVATSAQSSDVPCDDTTACQDGTTCCKTKEGGWACCPLPEAVCCDDHEHCCPTGTTCDLATLSCQSSSGSTPMQRKMPAFATAAPTTVATSAQSSDVPCDDTTACQDGTTCCKTKESGWACCPLPEAVCCDDHEHCCPTGTTCDLATLSCQSSSGSTPMQRKMPAFATAAPTTVATSAQSTVVTTTQQTGEEKNKPEEDEVMTKEEEEENKEGKGRIQCDTHTSCPQHTTCCFMASSQKWGCCPLPKAVCCADGNHCCPTHYKCNEQGSSCVQGEVVIPWYTKLPATTSIQADPSSVQCDGLSQCPEHTTCCQLSTGEWGCCPLQNAVCCPDKEHCCPQGYTCNVASNSCQKLIMLQLETVPLTPVYLSEHQPQLSPLKHRDVQCDEQTSCKDGQTCCRMSATTWGCCPYTNAVCCSDMMYCCPTGYTCTESGGCIQNTRLHWYNWHVFVANKKRALIL